MSHLLTPKLDLVFKLLFAQDTDLLLDLVNTRCWRLPCRAISARWRSEIPQFCRRN